MIILTQTFYGVEENLITCLYIFQLLISNIKKCLDFTIVQILNTRIIKNLEKWLSWRTSIKIIVRKIKLVHLKKIKFPLKLFKKNLDNKIQIS